MPAAAPAPTRERWRMLVNRDFALLWAGQGISQIGDWVFDTTLVVWIGATLARGQSWAPLAVSGVLVATALPYVVLGPIAGVFVDRWDKRQVMLRADLARALLIALLLATTFLVLPVSIRLALAYVVVFLAGLCTQFFRPAQTALIGDIVPEPRLERASGLSELTTNLAFVLGPAVAAPLLTIFGVQSALAVNALSFCASFAALLAISAPASARQPADAPAHMLGELIQGLRFYFANRVLTTLLVSFVVLMLGGGAFNALALFFVTENLHAPAALYAVAVAAVGLGALAGAVFASLFGERVGAARMFWLATLMTGLSVIVLARMQSFVPGLIVYIIFGFSQGPANAALMPLVLRATPRALVGRVVAVLEPAIMTTSVLSLALAGLLLSTALRGFHARVLGLSFGPIDTIYTVMGLLTVLSALYARHGLRPLEPGAGRGPEHATDVTGAEAPLGQRSC